MIITEYTNNNVIPPAPNLANNRGLVHTHGKVFRVFGFFNVFDKAELKLYNSGPIRAKSIVYHYELFGLAQDYTKIGRADRLERIRMNLDLFNIKSEHVLLVSSMSNLTTNTIFVFVVDDTELSIFDLPTSSPHQALRDYLESHDNIPLITSSNRLVALLGSKSKLIQEQNDERIIFSATRIDINNIDMFFTDIKKVKPPKKKASTEPVLTDEQRMANEAPITKLEGYDAIYNNEPLLALHKRIVAQANRIGGFVDFNYKGTTWKIPKVPLLIWCNDPKNSALRISFEGATWRLQSPEELKCSQDSPIHSDWWIGAGIPIEAYGLFSESFMFNRKLSEFAADIAGQNTLGNVKVLAGKNLPPVIGRVNRYPSSIDDIKEGDILILEHGSVEFDSYIKKACQNGKGAVIIEVGNVVSHLSIVANELGLRLMQLPNARSLISPLCYEIKVDTRKGLISNLTNKPSLSD